MASKRLQSSTVSPGSAPASTSTAATTAAPQRAGNAAAVDRAGVAGPTGGFGGDLGEVTGWMWDQAKDLAGFSTDETEYPFELAQQTASNTAAAAKRLQEASALAKGMGADDLARHLGAAGARLGTVDGLATDLTTVVKIKKDLDLVQRFSSATRAMVAVDMRGEDAAATFDTFFAVAGELGVEISQFGGMWGPILAPYAEFLQRLGESGFFANMKKGFAMQGTVNGANMKNLQAAESDL